MQNRVYSSFVARDILNAAVNERIAPKLKELGYKKKSLTWTVATAALTKLVTIRGSRYNSTSDSSFTVDLGLYQEELHLDRCGVISKGAVSLSDCDVTVNIGELMGRNGHSWTIAHNWDNEKALDGMVYNFDRHVYSWLETHNTLNDIQDYYSEREMWFDAAKAAHLLGLDPSAHIEAALTDAHHGFASTIRRWARKHGLEV